jgi:hypothetical protein
VGYREGPLGYAQPLSFVWARVTCLDELNDITGHFHQPASWKCWRKWRPGIDGLLDTSYSVWAHTEASLCLCAGPSLLKILVNLLLDASVGRSGRHHFVVNERVKKCLFEELTSLSIFRTQFTMKNPEQLYRQVPTLKGQLEWIAKTIFWIAVQEAELASWSCCLRETFHEDFLAVY